MTISGFLDRALPVALLALILMSPLTVMIDGRDIENIDYFAVVDAEGVGAWLSRIASLAILAVAMAAIVANARAAWPSASTAQMVMIGYLVFFLTNSALNSVFGTVPSFVRYQMYPLIVLVAFYMQRGAGSERMLETAKLALMILMVASLVFVFVRPEATLRSYTPEVRLPFVGFRFWGLGNSPNSIGPLAFLLCLLIIHRPFRSRLVTLIGLAMGAVVVLIAQSQTAWITTALVLPAYVLYRRQVDPAVAPVRSPGLAVAALALTLVATAGVLIVYGPDLLWLSIDDVADDKSFTGRGRIWRMAIELYRDNPLFGYGPTAWEDDFRKRVNLPFAFTAHNQVLQALSTAGLVGLTGWVYYVGTLIVAAVRLSRPTRGLAPAMLVAFPLVRSFSEAPFEFKSILADDFIVHVIFFALLTGVSAAQAVAMPARAPSLSRRPGIAAI